MIETLDVSSWTSPFDEAVRARAVQALESGQVVFLPYLPFDLRDEEKTFLDPCVASGDRKNISLDPATGRVGGTALTGADAERLAAMMERFGQQTIGLVTGLIPAYTGALERARTSFRPVEVAGRPQSPRHDDRLLHVDAFPTRPMRGRRILRVFSNVAPDGNERDWRVGEPFEDFARKFLPRVPRPLPGSDLALNMLGLTKGRRSAYDRIMLSLHDQGKLDSAYQTSAPKTGVKFPAGSTWLVFTDQVLHAALGGRFALEQTFHLPVSAMAEPDRSPLRVLERLSGRALA